MTLPPDVRLISGPDSVRLVLPRRPARGARWIGCLPILFGLFFAGFAVFWMMGALGVLDRHPNARPARAPVARGPEAPLPGAVRPAPMAPRPAMGWFQVVFALFGVPFVIAGLVPVGIGILLFLPSHAEIVITSDELISVEQIGPLFFRRRRPLAEIGRLRVGQDSRASAGRSGLSQDHGIFAENAVSPGEALPPPLRLGRGYPVEMLSPVAGFLLEELKRRGNARVLHAGAAAPGKNLTLAIEPDPVAASDAAAPGAVAEEPELPQPENSKISFIPAPDAITFIIPHTGFRGAALFFLMFSLFWDAISFPMFGVALWQLLQKPSGEHLGIVAFMSVFVVIGIGTLLASIQSAYRKAVLLATRDSLVFTQTGPIRKSEYQWNPGGLTAIRCANSNTTINDQPLKELRIQSTAKGNSSRGLLVGRKEDELAWLAAALRRFYRVRD